MKYLHNTRYIHLLLEDDNTGVLKWYIDGSFAVHNNMKSHTGINLTIDKGIIHDRSLRHKLNIKNLTESKIVSVSDRINQLLWTKYFLEYQGYQIY